MCYRTTRMVASSRIFTTGVAIVLILLFSVLVVTYGSVQNDWQRLVWYCNHVPALIGIALLIDRSHTIAAGIVSVGLIPQLLWSLDLLAAVVVGFHPFDLTAYIFGNDDPWSDVLSILTHTLVPLLALALITVRPPPARSLLVATVYVLGLYLLTLLVVPPDSDLNCVYQSCLASHTLTIPGYTVLWPMGALLGLALPGWYLLRQLAHLRSRMVGGS